MSGGSGGKGGSATSSVTVPKWIQDAAKRNLSRADYIGQIGYTPYYGPDVAAFSPMQLAAMNSTNAAANAFGMGGPADAMSGMPAPQTYAGGVQGYGSAPLYQGALDQLQANAPGQFEAISNMFIDPVTGAAPPAPFGSSKPKSNPSTNAPTAGIGPQPGTTARASGMGGGK